jgi:hypothetical protein
VVGFSCTFTFQRASQEQQGVEVELFTVALFMLMTRVFRTM